MKIALFPLFTTQRTLNLFEQALFKQALLAYLTHDMSTHRTHQISVSPGQLKLKLYNYYDYEIIYWLLRSSRLLDKLDKWEKTWNL